MCQKRKRKRQAARRRKELQRPIRRGQEALLIGTSPADSSARREQEGTRKRIHNTLHQLKGSLANLKKGKEKQPMPVGTIKQVMRDRRFGFIASAEEEGDDIFFHTSALEGLTIRDLKEGDAVVYEVEEGEKGPRATVVRKAEEG